ncbi:MAG: hypothetical protein JWP25_8632 [Bradyrhizobium sp.]|nr:hypothetical protein [Bradyrhizobium sp.]
MRPPPLAIRWLSARALVLNSGSKTFGYPRRRRVERRVTASSSKCAGKNFVPVKLTGLLSMGHSGLIGMRAVKELNLSGRYFERAASAFLRVRPYSANIRPRIHHRSLSIEPSTSENLWKLHGVLRWLAADRSTRTSGPAGGSVPVQHRASLFNLRRTPPASVPRIHLRMACRLKSAA